jgi:hypothetical protein
MGPLEDQLQSSLQIMRKRGDADSGRLTHVLMAAFQGGILLAQVAADLARYVEVCGAIGSVDHTLSQ